MKKLKMIPRVTDIKRKRIMRMPSGAEEMSPSQPQEAARPGEVVDGRAVRLNMGELDVVASFMVPWGGTC